MRSWLITFNVTLGIYGTLGHIHFGNSVAHAFRDFSINYEPISLKFRKGNFQVISLKLRKIILNISKVRPFDM